MAAYVGSPEHKLPNARSDATLCPPELESRQPELTGWIKNAIAQGCCGGFMEGAFPRYVWHKEGGRFFEGRLTNQVLGEYKGYPIDLSEVPPELRIENA